MKNAIGALLVIALFTTGCAKSSMNSSSLLVNSGLSNTADVQMVVYQAAGYGHLPMSQQMPLRGQPRQMTTQKDVAAIFDAINRPDGNAQTRQARNNRLAFVGKNGDVVMFGITVPTVSGCDITAEQSSSKLNSALRVAMTQARVNQLSFLSPIKSVSYHDASGATMPASANNQTLRELLGHYSPLVLKGNRRCKTGEMQQLTKHAPRFFTIKLAKSDAIKAIIEVKDSEWPPKVYNTNTRLEQVKFDAITIFNEGNGLARFVFFDTQSNECLFTDPVNSRRIVKEAQGRNPRVYGPDLFEEVVSALTKP